MDWFWDMSYARWITEAMMTDELIPYSNVYDTAQSARYWGYTLNRFWIDIAYVVVFVVISKSCLLMLLLLVLSPSPPEHWNRRALRWRCLTIRLIH